MTIKKLAVLIGLSVLITGCASGMYPEYSSPSSQQLSAAEMGKRYLLGRGVPQDNQKAFNYFLQAANEGDAKAQNEVGFMYATGKGTEQNDELAMKYYERAANQGLASAQYSLGQMYAYGLGTVPNQTMANEWYQQSAAQGFEPAIKALKKTSRATAS